MGIYSQDDVQSGKVPEYHGLTAAPVGWKREKPPTSTMPNLKWSLLATLLFAIGIGPANSYVAVPRAGTVAVLVGTNSSYKLATYPTLTWSLVGGSAPGGGRQAHSANLLSDGRMVILGGACQTGMCPFSDVLVFDTNSGLWTLLTASLVGTAPLPRISHISVTTHDNKIIIHGGELASGLGTGDIAVLDMKAANLAWSVPATTGTAPTLRFAHSAAMVGTIAFIMFGQSGTTIDNKIYALDTDTWTWLQTYNPSHLEYTNTGNVLSNPSVTGSPATPITGSPTGLSTGSPGVSSTEPSPPMPIAMYIGIGFGAVCVAAAVIAGFLFYRRRKRDYKDPYVDQNPVVPDVHNSYHYTDHPGQIQPNPVVPDQPHLVLPDVHNPYPHNDQQPHQVVPDVHNPYPHNDHPNPMQQNLVGPNGHKYYDPNDYPRPVQPRPVSPEVQKPNDLNVGPKIQKPNDPNVGPIVHKPNDPNVGPIVHKPNVPSFSPHAHSAGNFVEPATSAIAERGRGQ
ncbi:hypothetical protein BC936DRAFT_141983 [Jimgerdemannia flammicorona]|uniref:Galactose oxidase n=1 Tax=Jimgerdemannia flammicorona TaxID=994334 RepID=A0A433DFL2_9FUNG|nr:hypothetical protein BC936DRAFT_141983 [Jimgerdemannia flammicorona]